DCRRDMIRVRLAEAERCVRHRNKEWRILRMSEEVRRLIQLDVTTLHSATRRNNHQRRLADDSGEPLCSKRHCSALSRSGVSDYWALARWPGGRRSLRFRRPHRKASHWNWS